jgi:AcrR family transcriptional regulator
MCIGSRRREPWGSGAPARTGLGGAASLSRGLEQGTEQDLGRTAPAATGTDEGEPDGRRRRSHDSRARIVAAMLALVRAGEVSPGAEQVAEHAEVGLRTVFRHFKDMDSLYGEMSKLIEGELVELTTRPLAGATWRERLAELVARRAVVFEKIGPFRRASEIHRHRSRFLEAGHARLGAQLRAVLTREAPPEILADPSRLEVLDLLLSFEAWNRLRRDQGLAPADAEAVLTRAALRVAEG